MTSVTAAPPIWPGLRTFQTPWAKWLAVFLIVTLLYFVVMFRGLGILGMLAVSGAYIASLSSAEMARIAKQAPLLAYPLMAVLSGLWSDAPALSLRLGAQLLITAVIALALYRTVPFRTFMSALFFAGLLACGISVLLQPAAILGHYPLNGITASKNAMAYIANASAICSVAIVVDRGFTPRLRLIAAGGLLLSVICLVAAQSAGALVASAVGCAVVLAVRAFLTSAATIRAVVLLGALLLAPVVLVAGPAIEQEANTFAQDVLDKDTTTLTGRTYLWQRASEYIAEKPVVGHGFGAFWRQGNLEAEGLWRAYGITNREGFNFHNQFYEALMDMGFVGLAVLIGTIAIAAAGFALRILRGGGPESPFYVGMFLSLVMRVSVESALLTQFTTVTILFFMSTCAAVYGPEAQAAFAKLRSRRLRQTKDEARLTQKRVRVARTGPRTLVQLRETPRAATRATVTPRTKKLRRTRADLSKPTPGPRKR